MMINEVKNIAKCFPLTKTSFCINGDEFPPELLTEQFHLSPTVAWRKGELRKDFGGNRYYEKHPDIFPGQYTFSH